MSQRPIGIVDSYVAAGDETPTDGSKFHTRPCLTQCSDRSLLLTTLAGSEKTGPDGRTKVLKSAEVDIRTNGRLDYSDRLLERLDLVIASIHQGFRKNATERMCAAIEHPLVHMVAHPTGRIIGRREGYDIDLDKVLTAAARCRVVLEINAFYGRLDLNDIWARKASELGIRLAVNTDAHAVEDLDWMRFGVLTARRAWLTKKDIVNCLTYRQLTRLLGSISRNK